MDKLSLAHDYFMKHGDSSRPISSVEEAWDYVDLMLAEEEKRRDKSLPVVFETIDEFEVDWSQAPETAIAWKMRASPNGTVWIHDKALCGFDYSHAPDFGYTGDWKQSLRERP